MMTDRKEIAIDACPSIRWEYIDESFKRFVKRVKRKGYCTVSSCSGVSREHAGARKNYRSRNGYMTILMFDLSRKARALARKKYQLDEAIENFDYEDVASLSKTPEKSRILHDRIMDAARKDGFGTDFIFWDYSRKFPNGAFAVTVSPLVPEGKRLNDAGIVDAWDGFTADL